MKTVKVKGMSCNHCVVAVKKALEEMKGIQGVSVDLEKGEASFEEMEPVETKSVEERIQKAGYEIG